MEKMKLYLLNNKNKVMIIIIIIAIVVYFFGYFGYKNYLKEENLVHDITYEENDNDFIIENIEENSQIEEIEEVVEYIYIDIKGYVDKPGVYKFDKNGDNRINDLIKTAGGLKKDADTSIINMSLKLKDEMVVIIYSKKEISNFLETKKEQENKLEICEKDNVKNDGCITNEDVIVEDEKNNSEVNDSNTGKVNINTASKEELMNIPNIGESKALAIISYRNEIGLFKNISDIKNVSGIGENVFEKIKDYITIE